MSEARMEQVEFVSHVTYIRRYDSKTKKHYISYYVLIPKEVAEVLGVEPGKKVKVRIEVLD